METRKKRATSITTKRLIDLQLKNLSNKEREWYDGLQEKSHESRNCETYRKASASWVVESALVVSVKGINN